MKKRFNVEGMSCSACSASVERAVGRLDGVKSASVNLLSKTLICEFDDKKINEDRIISAVEKAGFSASEIEKPRSEASRKEETTLPTEKTRLIVSGIFLIILMYFSMGHMLSLPIPHFFHTNGGAIANAFSQFLLTLPILFVNRKFFYVGARALKSKSPNMDTLVSLGSLAGVVYGIFAIYMMSFAIENSDMALLERYRHNLYFESSAMILTLVTLGKFFEERSKRKTGDALHSLEKLRDEVVVVEREGVEITVPFAEVRVGDVVILRPGSRASVDGVIVEGEGSFDLSTLTGESLPVFKKEGDRVMSASICLDSFVKIRATEVGGDTTLSEMIRLVETAGATKAPISRLADKISAVFVPLVILISLITFVIWMIASGDFEFSLSLALSVLVISCPCALGLATPVAITVSVGRLAKEAILVKEASFAERASKIKTVIFDKTGTLTEGKMTVSDVIGDDRDALLCVATTLERGSEHPIAKAIVSEFSEYSPLDITDFVSISGKGVVGSVKGDRISGGNRALMQDEGVSITHLLSNAEKLEEVGKTVVFFARGGKALGLIALSDKIKEGARDTVIALKKMGIKTVLLTGDNDVTARAVAKDTNVDECISKVLPADKESYVRAFKKEGSVMMVGDGINDSPSIASADIGVAIGSGTDIAIDASDVILMSDDVRLVLRLIKYSRTTLRIIKENLFWAFIYNVIGIPISAGVLFLPFGITLNPMISAVAMSFSSLFVVTNALRLMKK